MNTDTLPQRPTAGRRRLLYAGLAAGAALAGAGVAWRRLQSEQTPASDEAAALWPLSFPTPAGEPLLMAKYRGKPLLLNFWATWCPPCVDEMPLLDSFFRENAGKGWQVVGLALDQAAPVRSFLTRVPVTFPIGLAASGGQELTRTLGNQASALPFSVVVGSAGQIHQRKMGRITTAELAAWRSLK
jgi:thiol-disulfide isomerase/thioredoxin